MNIATRYAKALASTLSKQDTGEQQAAYEGMKQLLQVMAKKKTLSQALQNNALDSAEKLRLLATAAEEASEEAWLNRFFALVIRHRRESLMRNIAHVFLQIYRSSHGIVDVRVETAAPMSAADRNRLEERLASKLGGTVECTYKVCPGLIGGIRILTGDKLIDATYATQLETLRQRLQSL